MNDQLEQLEIAEKPRLGERPAGKSFTGELASHKSFPSPAPSSVRPAANATPTKKSAFDDNEEGEETAFDRHKGKLFLLAVVLIGGATAYLMSLPKSGPIHRAPERMMTVTIPPPAPPPPPPPPPPKVQPPPEEKMIEQAPVEEEKPEQKVEEPPPSIGTGIKGDGPGLAGLSGKGDGSRIGGNGAGRTAGRWDFYARGVQSSISEKIRQNPKTRSASIRSVQVRIWVDATGRVTRVKLMGTTGDSTVDAALQNEVLTGLQLQSSPPPGMPLPIVLRVSARRA